MILGLVAVVVTVLGVVALAVIRLIRGPEGGAAASEEEARQLAELHAGLERMERRIESLETILLDKEQPK